MLSGIGQASGDDVEQFYTVDPTTGLTPLQAAVKRKHLTGLRRWDQVAAILRTPNLDLERAGAGYAVLVAAKENFTLAVQQLMETIDDLSFCSASNDFYPQHWAVVHRNVVMLEALLANGASPNQVSKQEKSPLDLVLLSAKPNKKIIQCLCRHDVYLNDSLLKLADERRWDLVSMVLMLDKREHAFLKSALMIAAIDQDRTDMVAFLARTGASLHAPYHPAKYAATKGKWRCVAAMIKCGERETLNRVLASLLVIAAAEQEWDIVGKIFARKPSENECNESELVYRGKTTMQWLVHHKNTKWLRIALTASLTKKKLTDLKKVMSAAVEYEYAEGVRLLAQQHVSSVYAWQQVVRQQNWDGMICLLENDHRDLKILIEDSLYVIAYAASADFLCQLIKRFHVSIESAVESAINAESWSIVLRLLEASPDYRNNRQLQTILKVAIDYDLEKLLIQLLAHDVDINTRVCEGRAPAMYAAYKRRWNLVRLFTACERAEPIKSGLAEAIGLAAAARDSWDTVNAIIVYMAKHNRPALFNNYVVLTTAIHAIKSGQADILAALLQGGLPWDEHDGRMLDLAEEVKAERCVKVLVSYGANYHHRTLKLAKSKNWAMVLSSIDPERYTQSQLQLILIACVKNNAPMDIIKYLDGLIKNINGTVEETTGNNLIHLSVIADNPEFVAFFKARGVSTQAVNLAGKMPMHLLYQLNKYRLSFRSVKEIAMILMGSLEWLNAFAFEQDSESHNAPSVSASKRRSLARLNKRYPNVDVDRCIQQYFDFLKTLPEPLRRTGKLSAEDFDLRNIVALIWTAACDKHAVPAAQRHNSSFIRARQESLVEHIAQAHQDIKCTAGIISDVVSALNHAHPDVIIIYDESHLNAEITELLESMVTEMLPLMLTRLKTDAQLLSARQLRNAAVIPAFYSLLKREIEDEIKQQYAKLIDAAVLDTMLAPAELAKIRFDLPDVYRRFITVLNDIQDFITKCQQSSIVSTTDMEYLTNLLNGEYDDDTRNLTQNCEFLERELKKCIGQRAGENLKAVSIFKPNKHHAQAAHKLPRKHPSGSQKKKHR